MAKKDEQKLELVRQMVESAEHSLHSAREMLRDMMGIDQAAVFTERARNLNIEESGKVIEGIFDGEGMYGADEKKYPVPANYASKSKLVQGDKMKLTILEDGSFVYKQIGPVERKKLIGTLLLENDHYKVVAEGKTFNVLLASVTYFKAEAGDDVTIDVPAEGESEWAAIEAVIPKAPAGTSKKKVDDDEDAVDL